MAEVPRILTQKQQEKTYWFDRRNTQREAVLKEIRELLASPGIKDQKAGLMGAGWAIAYEVFDDVLPYLHHSMRMMQETACFTLSRLPDKLLPLLSPLPAPDFFPDEFLATLLLKQMRKWGNPLLSNMLAEGDAYHLQLALDVCTQRRYCPMDLMEKLLDGPDPARRDIAIRLLGHAGGPEAIPLLAWRVSLADRKTVHRIESALTAQVRRNKNVVASTMEKAPQGSLEMAVLATALSKIEDIRALEPAFGLLKSGQPQLQIHGVRILRRLRNEQGIEPLLALYPGAVDDVKVVILDAIGRWRLQEFVPLLERGLQETAENLLRVTKKALAKYISDEQITFKGLPSAPN